MVRIQDARVTIKDARTTMQATQESFASSEATLAKRRERRIVRAKATDISNVAIARSLGFGSYTTSQAVRAGAANQVLANLQAGLDLNQLEQKLRKDMKGHAKLFWEWLRKLVEAKFGKTDVAFRVFSCHKDGLLSSQAFQELCESIGLSIEPRLQKALFEMGCRRKSEMVCSFQDFQDALLAAKLDLIRSRMNTYNNSIRRIGNHVDNFIKRLSLESGDDNRRRAFSRLQKKMGIPFCIEVQSGLHRFVERIGRAGKLECLIHTDDFMRIVDTAAKFQQYELGMIRNIFDRIDRTRCSSVNMSDIVVALTLLASECQEQENLRMEKLKFLFCVFDADNDGCLTCEEILRMFCSIAIFSTIARGDHPAYDADITLDDELSLAKARRLYDFCAIYLDQNGVQDLCTFDELWSVFLAFPKVMEELIPGTYSNSIMWVLRPLPPLRKDDGDKRHAVSSRQSNGSGANARSSERRPSKKAAAPGHVLCKTPTAASAPQLGAPVSPSRPSRTERYREQAAIRFRHAMRGEWDVVNHLQSEPPPSRQGLSESPSRLPQIVTPAHASATGSTSPIEKTNISWAEASHKFDRRQGESHWQARHRQSITNWTRGSDSEEPCMLHRNSRSLPNLRLNSAPRKEPTRSAADHKIAELNAQEARFLESMPAESERFGKDALPRLRDVCKALHCGGNSSHPNGHAVTDCIQYDCHLCHGRHDVAIPYMA